MLISHRPLRLIAAAGIAGMLALALGPGSGAAEPPVTDPPPELARNQCAAAEPPMTEPPLELARNQCAYLRQSEGRVVLFNACGSCVEVQVEHRRPGGDFPTYRAYTLVERGEQDLPVSFRSGSSRILEEKSCTGTGSEPAFGQCVNFFQTRDGTPALVNSCNVCRTVTVERSNPRGARSVVNYSVNANGRLPLAAQGADRARIVNEKPCG